MPASHERRSCIEISLRFRLMIEERIARLEKDAVRDETQIANLDDVDHIRRQTRLVAAQRAEALRMKHFLDHSKIRMPWPLIAL